MNKNIVAVIVGCLYVAVSSWIVSTQGKAYRDALRQATAESPAAAKPDSRADSPAQTGDVARPAVMPEVAGQPRKAAASGIVLADRSIRGPRSPEVVEEPRHPAAIRPGPHPSAPNHSKTPEPAGPIPAQSVRLAFARAVGADVSHVRPTAIDPFWSQPFATKKWEVGSLSADDERRLGADLHAMVMHLMPRWENADAQERVERVARPILAARSRKEIDYQFFVLDSRGVNAFSHPGGYVYLSRGLLDWISADEDCALQFVLAHEVFHVDRKHAIACLQDPGVKELPYGTLQLFYLFIFPRGYYPEKLDFDADAWALLQLKRLQCTRRECLTFLRKLKGYADSHNWGLDRASALPRSGKTEALFDNHFRAHPPTYQRLEKLEKLVDEMASKSP